MLFNKRYVLPKSYYMMRFNLLFGALVGYKYANYRYGSFIYQRLLNDIGSGKIPKEVVDALENHDARYAKNFLAEIANKKA